MQTQTQNDTIQTTFRGIVWGKFLRFIENNTVTSIAQKLTELFLGLFLGVLLFKPDAVANAALTMLKMQNFALPKIMAGLIIIYGRKFVYKIPGKIRKFRIVLAQANVQKMHNPVIDGIPIDELADHLIRNGHFRREGINGVRATFGLRMEKFNALAGRLEANGVLVRGENNLRVLAPKWSRQALIDFLSQTDKSKNMTPWFRVHRIGEGAKIRLDRQEITA